MIVLETNRLERKGTTHLRLFAKCRWRSDFSQLEGNMLIEIEGCLVDGSIAQKPAASQSHDSKTGKSIFTTIPVSGIRQGCWPSSVPANLPDDIREAQHDDTTGFRCRCTAIEYAGHPDVEHCSRAG